MLTTALIGTGLAMDAFSVSLTNGMNIKKGVIKEAFKTALFFGVFQFLMPVIGFFAAGIFKSSIEAVDHWIAFVLLAFIGIKMISEALEKKDENAEINTGGVGLKILTVQAVATSIDALAVGISFAALNVPIFSSSALIGAITFVLCFFAVIIGKKVGDLLSGKAEILGGIILVCIGVKILLEHLFF